MTTFPHVFLGAPIAHRALHDRDGGRPENSREAIMAAVERGYGIEIDLQPSSDGVPMVFHDYHLDRLTDETGAIRLRTAEELSGIRLTGGTTGIPTLAEVLELVDGRAPLLVEVKDQDGAMGSHVGALERAAAKLIADYRGPLALMSFNPHSMAAMAELLPDVPRGLTTCAFRPGDWPLPPERLEELAQIPDYDRVGACFISHGHRDLAMPRVAELKDAGAALLTWTIRSPEDEAAARRIAQNITFEHYDAAFPTA
ncbi:glycerophosphodiester phosphodiesterase family protein [Tranquillimonas alkanivorans]|uniref:Glycerophosphoryl diester phosphodiesterase n=1 Tax=Tranquillimonas alkanivorans TaxID=441119 RepID=A0A1I5PJI1_9RHOB|nr:glycerophosphodiester phosphodiesterase family protein [Tranquillimonas alkanivorans]SFP33701.1 Glycerophosphoryl diester phosphodiesterase [Tranquillimonas alkanivorans]